MISLSCDYIPQPVITLSIATDHQGAIVDWDIELVLPAPFHQLVGTRGPGHGGAFDFAQVANTGGASVFDQPGTWSGPVTATPEPSTVILMSTMLLAVALVARKRRSLRPATRTTP